MSPDYLGKLTCGYYNTTHLVGVTIHEWIQKGNAILGTELFGEDTSKTIDSGCKP